MSVLSVESGQFSRNVGKEQIRTNVSVIADNRLPSRENVKISDNPQVLEIIREEQHSPLSSMKFQPSTKSATPASGQNVKCLCGEPTIQQTKVDPAEVEKLLNERIIKLRAEYDKLLQKEIASVKERFDFILQNEQIRTSYMLREAHRERQEKIRALESQLHCKNLSALMYVMCSERTRSRLEKLQLIEEYTEYISGLHEILAEGQSLILNLSRGYKTATRVDHEWREKMKKVVSEFMNFIHHFTGEPPENNQYFFDLPNLLKTEAPLEDDPNEDPCDESVCEEEASIDMKDESKIGERKVWWETLEDGNKRPFIVFGDMSEFMPPQRRQVLQVVKAKKTAPKIWKEYRFNDMSLRSSCDNADAIKDTMTYPRYKHIVSNDTSEQDLPSLRPNGNAVSGMTLSSMNRRGTATAADMGSILKIITLASAMQAPADKSALLAVRDSLEVISTTRLRQHGRSMEMTPHSVTEHPVKLEIGKKRLSHFSDLVEKKSSADEESVDKLLHDDNQDSETDHDDDEFLHAALGSSHNDSMNVMSHIPDKDHKINYERICPVPQCERMHVDSFMRTLPEYMRASPFTHFQQTFEEYEPCTKEQLEILKKRIEAKHAEEKQEELVEEESPTKEWETGLATQTSVQSFLDSCTCAAPSPTPDNSQIVFDLHDLLPVKLVLDAIQKECLFDERIEFDRFKLIGEEKSSEHFFQAKNEKPDFKTARVQEIRRILGQHPSLLDIFQADAKR